MRTLLFVFILASLESAAQVIPNSGFESWFVDIWQPEPQGWDTPNGQTVPIVTQDTASYEGEYAMRVSAVEIGVGAVGWARCTLATSFIPASLDFYVKTMNEFGAVSVSISFFNGENEFYVEEWTSSENIMNWSFISLPLSQIEPVMTHAVIEVKALVGDFTPGSSWISVDAMSFESTLHNDSSRNPEFSVFPNPATDWVQLNGASLNSKARLYDLKGKLIAEYAISSIEPRLHLSGIKRGLYILEVENQSGFKSSQKLVVR